MGFGPKTTQALLSDVLAAADKHGNGSHIVIEKPRSKPPLWTVEVFSNLPTAMCGSAGDKLLDVALRRVLAELKGRGSERARP